MINQIASPQSHPLDFGQGEVGQQTDKFSRSNTVQQQGTAGSYQGCPYCEKCPYCGRPYPYYPCPPYYPYVGDPPSSFPIINSYIGEPTFTFREY